MTRSRSFTPISLVASSPNILLVKADSPFKTIGDVIAAAKAKPGSLTFGEAGNGTSTHLAGELFKNLAKIDIGAISYKGGLPAINDLLGGQIPLSFNNGPESVGQLKAGTVRALGVTTAKRAAFLPDVPSIGETVPGYDTEVWWGLLGPAGMPPELVTKLSQDFVAALNTDSVKERLAQLGAGADRHLRRPSSMPRSMPITTNGARSSKPRASSPKIEFVRHEGRLRSRTLRPNFPSPRCRR